MKAYDNKTALLKTVLKTVMDPPPPGGLNLPSILGLTPEFVDYILASSG